jgi:SAM-dependent methyltransferase
MLDVGAAAGFLLDGFRQAGWTGEGVEPNDRMAAHAREVLGLSVHTGTLESLGLSGTFDLISLIQVVAHFPDPMAAFRVADRVTRPGGHWLIETWNSESLTAKVWGRGWHEYSPPSVLHWFSRASLRAALRSLGYRQVGIGTLGKWLSVGHAKSLLRHTLAGSAVGRVVNAAASLLPDRLALPYPSEDLFWAVFRKG